MLEYITYKCNMIIRHGWCQQRATTGSNGDSRAALASPPSLGERADMSCNVTFFRAQMVSVRAQAHVDTCVLVCARRRVRDGVARGGQYGTVGHDMVRFDTVLCGTK